MAYAHTLKPGKKVDLSKIPTSSDGGLNKEEGVSAFQKISRELQELQKLMYGASSHGLLVIVQGRDTAGKDGAINSILQSLDAMGCQTYGFKAPSSEELSRDFLWRVHQRVPPRGTIALFNRSHYEDVLVARVHSLVPESIWKRRYEHIDAFESLLIDTHTLVVKIYLHISQEEQEKRLLSREADVSKAWKLSLGDWKERELWEDYTRAYEEAMRKCSKAAPWHVIPADRKWFRNLAIAELLVHTLKPFAEDWNAVLSRRGEEAKEEILAWRAQR